MSDQRFSPDHTDAHDELAVGWALHALEPEDESLFALHLPACERCARTVAETEEVMAAMARDLPPAEPSAGLRHRLQMAVAETEQRGRPDAAPLPVATSDPEAQSGSRPVLPAWRRALPTALVAAAVAAILGLGIWNVALAESRERLRSTVAEQNRVMEHLLTGGEATIAPLMRHGHQVATVVARPNGVQVITDGLTVNDRTTTTYVVWGAGADGMVPLGTFDVVHSQIDVRSVGSDQPRSDQYPGYGISIERGRNAPPRPTEIVATGTVPR
jgi:hypothetical protein